MKVNYKRLSNKIAFITINPKGRFLKSAQLGFKEVGLYPQHLIHVSSKERLKSELKKYKLSFINKFLFPQIKNNLFNKKSFSDEITEITIQNSYKVDALNNPKTVELIQKIGVKYLINCGAGIFKNQLISIPGLIILNAHAGMLPNYKNMNVVEWAIFNDDPVVGTVHQIERGIDTGMIWYQKNIDLPRINSINELKNHCFDKVIRMVGKVIIKYENNEIIPQVNNEKIGKNWYRMHPYFHSIIKKKLIKKK